MGDMGSVEVKCLGSGDAFGSGGRNNTSFYIKSHTGGILLDCGASTLIALKREGLSMDDIDLILITHLHGDHFGGLPFILCEIAAIGRRRKPLTIAGPDGIADAALRALDCFYPGVELTDQAPVKFLAYKAGQVLKVGDIDVEPFKVVHSPESKPHALRISCNDTIVAYSGDTEWTDILFEVSRDADLFICEGTTYDRKIGNHLSIREVLNRRDLITAKKIVFTHLAEEALKASSSVPLTIAHDGMILLDSNMSQKK